MLQPIPEQPPEPLPPPQAPAPTAPAPSPGPAPRLRKRRVLLPIAVVLGVAFAIYALRPLAPPPVARPIVPFSAEAAATHYRKNTVHNLASFAAKYDRSGNGQIDAAEATGPSARYAPLYEDVSAILNPTEALAALDRLTPEAAKGLLAERATASLDAISAGRGVREAYWRMDVVSQYLARRLRLLSPTTLALIDGGGERHLNGAEDLPPVMPFSDEAVRAYAVPWPPGNVAVADVGGRTRAFVTPFPDGNFSDSQVHELDLATGAISAYPSGRPDLQRALRCSLGVEAHAGVLYIVDHGGYGIRNGRLVAIDLLNDRVLLDYPFPIKLGQMPNDLAFVDTADRTQIFISDTAPGRSPWGLFNAKSGIIQIDVRRTGDTLSVVDQRRHLDGDPLVEDGGFSMYPDRDRPARTWLGKLAWGGIDGIAAHDGNVYFRRMQMPEIVVAPASSLDAAHANVLDRFPIIDGFHIDERGLLWFGDVEGGTLFAYDLSTRAMVKVLQDRRFHWLDEVNVLGDKAYVTGSHLHEFMNELLPWRRKQALAAAAPYFFYVVDLKPALRTIERLRLELAHD